MRALYRARIGSTTIQSFRSSSGNVGSSTQNLTQLSCDSMGRPCGCYIHHIFWHWRSEDRLHAHRSADKGRCIAGRFEFDTTIFQEQLLGRPTSGCFRSCARELAATVQSERPFRRHSPACHTICAFQIFPSNLTHIVVQAPYALFFSTFMILAAAVLPRTSSELRMQNPC